MKYELDMMKREEKGRKEGRLEGLEIATKILGLLRDGKTENQIAKTVGVDVATVRAMRG